MIAIIIAFTVITVIGIGIRNVIIIVISIGRGQQRGRTRVVDR